MAVNLNRRFIFARFAAVVPFHVDQPRFLVGDVRTIPAVNLDAVALRDISDDFIARNRTAAAGQRNHHRLDARHDDAGFARRFAGRGKGTTDRFIIQNDRFLLICQLFNNADDRDRLHGDPVHQIGIGADLERRQNAFNLFPFKIIFFRIAAFFQLVADDLFTPFDKLLFFLNFLLLQEAADLVFRMVGFDKFQPVLAWPRRLLGRLDLYDVAGF